MKFCKNCQHFNSAKSQCARPIGLSLVTGEPEFRKISAEFERTFDATGCGTQGRYFEQKDEEYYDSVDPINFGAAEYKKNHDCKRSGCTICVAFEH
jgi:hypothetical protein